MTPVSTLIKTAFRVKSSQGTQAGATQGSPQIQAKDSPKSELLTKPCLRKRPNKKCHNNPAYYKVRSSVGEECRLGFIRCGKRAPSVRSINLSNLRARAAGGRGRGWNSPFAEISPLSCPKGRERGGECARVWFLAPRLLPLRSLPA